MLWRYVKSQYSFCRRAVESGAAPADQSVLQRAAQQAQAAPAAVGQPASASAPVGAHPEQSIAERLQELKTLHDAGVLSDQKYAA